MTFIAMPLCAGCKPSNRDGSWDFRCAAFPDGIPEAITMSEADHREPFEGDRGIRFETIDDQATAYAEPLFTPLSDEPYSEDGDAEKSDAVRADVA
jgi:hypothetical protein